MKKFVGFSSELLYNETKLQFYYLLEKSLLEEISSKGSKIYINYVDKNRKFLQVFNVTTDINLVKNTIKNSVVSR